MRAGCRVRPRPCGTLVACGRARRDVGHGGRAARDSGRVRDHRSCCGQPVHRELSAVLHGRGNHDHPVPSLPLHAVPRVLRHGPGMPRPTNDERDLPMTVWWSRDATVCTCLLLVLCGLLAWVAGPLIGAPGAVSSLSATALTRWTAPPLTQTIVRAWCAHRHVPLPPPPPRRLVSQASAVAVLSCSVDALTSMWNAEPVAALMELVVLHRSSLAGHAGRVHGRGMADGAGIHDRGRRAAKHPVLLLGIRRSPAS